MTTLTNYDKNEQMVKTMAFVSAISFVIGIISGILYLIFEKNPMDTIAISGLTIFVVPVLAMQIAMPANWHTYGIRSMRWTSLIFFLIMFPAADIWFFNGINALYGIVPNFHLIEDRAVSEIVRIESAKQAWTYIGIIYVSLISFGFYLRLFKKSRAKIMLAY